VIPVAAPAPGRREAINSLELADKARRLLIEKNGEDIVLLDVRDLTEVTDYFLLVSGTSAPHLKALLNDLTRVLKDAGVTCYRKAGEPGSGWLALDYLDVVIHIFLPEVREYYAIEELWEKAPRLD
jgi:ribosome-associated protein